MKNGITPFRIEVRGEVLHFAALEEPELLAEGIRTWFRGFRGDH